MDLPQHKASVFFFEWLPVIGLMLIAGVVRWHSGSNISYLLSGGDGPYFPLQVRTLLTEGRLAMPDMPLLFALGALVAKVLQALHFGTTDECVLMAVRLTDAFLPPLAAIPVFLFSRELNPTSTLGKVLCYVMVAFAIINFTVTINFSYQLQKNGLGVLWVFWYLYFAFRFLKYADRKDFYWASFILMLCAATHFGSFTLLVLFSVLLAVIGWIYNRNTLKINTFQQILLSLIIFGLLLLMVAWFDTDRFQRFIFIPLRLFEFPVLLILLDGQDLSNYLAPMPVIITNILAFWGAILLLKSRKQIEKTVLQFAVALLVFAFFLASPLLGLEWANRLFLMSFLPIPFLYLILFNNLKSKWTVGFPALFVSGFMLLCIAKSWTDQRILSISDEAFLEFREIKNKVNFTPKTLILGRQDLRLLGSWVFGTKGTADYLFTNQDFVNYDAVYILKQIKGSNLPPARFHEPQIPLASLASFKGKYFELFHINAASGWKPGTGEQHRAKGEIIELKDDYMVLLNQKSGNRRTVDISKDLVFEGIKPGSNLKIGMQVEVFGHWKFFSLHVAGEKVREVKGW